MKITIKYTTSDGVIWEDKSDAEQRETDLANIADFCARREIKGVAHARNLILAWLEFDREMALIADLTPKEHPAAPDA